MIARWRQNAHACAALACAGALLGLALQALHPTPAGAIGWRSKLSRLDEDLTKLGASDPVRFQQARALATLDDVRRAAPDVCLVDARSAVLFRLGHIPGAFSLPGDSFAAGYADIQEHLHRAAAVIVYCSGASCEEADRVCEALRRLGHVKVLVFKGGWQEWTAAGLPEEKSR